MENWSFDNRICLVPQEGHGPCWGDSGQFYFVLSAILNGNVVQATHIIYVSNEIIAIPNFFLLYPRSIGYIFYRVR